MIHPTGGVSPGGISGSGSGSNKSCADPAEEELQFLLRHRAGSGSRRSY